MLKSVGELGFEVEHVYGITEASGTPVSCLIQADWQELANEEQARLKARQGNRAIPWRHLPSAARAPRQHPGLGPRS